MPLPNLINGHQAALIRQNLTQSALGVAKCEIGINRLQTLARTDPELRGLARALGELRETAEPMLFCDVAVSA